jgi:hypothetical protein
MCFAKFLWLINAIAISTLAQGFVNFRTQYGAGGVDAPVSLPDGSPVGPAFRAQLLGGPLGTAPGLLSPLLPTTVFRSESPTTSYYVVPVTVSAPNVPPGSEAVFIMRAFNAASWEDATIRGESALFRNLVGDSSNPLSLGNLRAFQVFPIPEPHPLILLFPGLMLLGVTLAKTNRQCGCGVAPIGSLFGSNT